MTLLDIGTRARMETGMYSLAEAQESAERAILEQAAWGDSFEDIATEFEEDRQMAISLRLCGLDMHQVSNWDTLD